MDIPVDNIVSVSDIQKNYRKVFDKAKRSKKPVVVMCGNTPEVAVLDIASLKSMKKQIEELELESTLRDIEEGEKELKMGQTKKADSLLDLLK